MSNRVRFAPSPTGNVHIGNIRVAIFNWLHARHSDGQFLLRVEDTDRERSTEAAINRMLECMDWLGLDHDGEILYQSSRAGAHIAAAEQLIESGAARKPEPKSPDDKPPVLFLIPWDTDDNPAVRVVGEVKLEIHPDTPVEISADGVSFALVSKKGKPMPQAGCLGGFHHLKVFDTEGKELFSLDDNINDIRSGATEFSANATTISFERREVFFNDDIKSELAKPLDGMKDLVIVRGDGSPVFHLANVCDDAFQGVTHIIRGDDHVENTYRHIFLFQALGLEPPRYAHLPMIVNDQGKPYSKRDGDAYVGDFQAKGYLAAALFNYLSLLGWSPGDDREKMNRPELVEAFSLDRVVSSPARFDIKKLHNLNGQYLNEMPVAEFTILAAKTAPGADWNESHPAEFAAVAKIMQPRTKALTDIESWRYFFADEIEYDAKAVRKFVKGDAVLAAIKALAAEFAAMDDFSESAIEAVIHHAEAGHGIQEGKLNQPLRVAVTGVGVGAGIYETIAILGKNTVCRRLNEILLQPRNGMA